MPVGGRTDWPDCVTAARWLRGSNGAGFVTGCLVGIGYGANVRVDYTPEQLRIIALAAFDVYVELVQEIYTEPVRRLGEALGYLDPDEASRQYWASVLQRVDDGEHMDPPC